MTAIGKDDQLKVFAHLLKPLGFKKHRATWHRETAEVIQTVNVQGSQWGPEYYLNIGTYLRALGDELAPPEYRCHIRSRIYPLERPARDLVRECQDWFVNFGTVAALVTHSRGGSLPLATTAAAREWLSAA